MMKTYGPLITHALIGLLGALGFTVDPADLAKVAPVLLSAWMVVAIVMHIPSISRKLATDAKGIGLSDDDLDQIAALLPKPADPSAAVADLAGRVDSLFLHPLMAPDAVEKIAAVVVKALAPPKSDTPPQSEGAAAGAGTGPAAVAATGQAQPGAGS